MMTAIQLVALVPFGGRTSLMLALATVVSRGVEADRRGARRSAVRPQAAAVAALVAPIAVAAALAAWFGGALAPLIERFSADRGSAAGARPRF